VLAPPPPLHTGPPQQPTAACSSAPPTLPAVSMMQLLLGPSPPLLTHLQLPRQLCCCLWWLPLLLQHVVWVKVWMWVRALLWGRQLLAQQPCRLGAAAAAMSQTKHTGISRHTGHDQQGAIPHPHYCQWKSAAPRVAQCACVLHDCTDQTSIKYSREALLFIMLATMTATQLHSQLACLPVRSSVPAQHVPHVHRLHTILPYTLHPQTPKTNRPLTCALKLASSRAPQ
jgi:hypothetical protein